MGFEFRNKFADTRWRSFWDYALFAGGLVPSVVFGVAFGNLLQGVPFRIDCDLRILYEGGGLFELLNPFGLLCGLVSRRDAGHPRRDLPDAEDGRRRSRNARRSS